MTSASGDTTRSMIDFVSWEFKNDVHERVPVNDTNDVFRITRVHPDDSVPLDKIAKFKAHALIEDVVFSFESSLRGIAMDFYLDGVDADVKDNRARMRKDRESQTYRPPVHAKDSESLTRAETEWIEDSYVTLLKLLPVEFGTMTSDKRRIAESPVVSIQCDLFASFSVHDLYRIAAIADGTVSVSLTTTPTRIRLTYSTIRSAGPKKRRLME